MGVTRSHIRYAHSGLDIKEDAVVVGRCPTL